MSYCTANYYTAIETQAENLSETTEQTLQAFTQSVVDKTADEEVLETFYDEVEQCDREGIYKTLCKMVNVDEKYKTITISWESEETPTSQETYYELVYSFLPLMKGEFVVANESWNDSRDGCGGDFSLLTKERKFIHLSDCQVTLPEATK